MSGTLVVVLLPDPPELHTSTRPAELAPVLALFSSLGRVLPERAYRNLGASGKLASS